MSQTAECSDPFPVRPQEDGNEECRGEFGTTDVVAQQVAREIQIHSGVEHEHIIRLYGAFEDGKHVYLVQEFAPGVSSLPLYWSLHLKPTRVACATLFPASSRMSCASDFHQVLDGVPDPIGFRTKSASRCRTFEGCDVTCGNAFGPPEAWCSPLRPSSLGAGGDLYEELKRVGGRFKERDTAVRVLGPALEVRRKP